MAVQERTRCAPEFVVTGLPLGVRRAVRRVETGEALWNEWRFRRWLVGRAAVHGWELIEAWAGTPERVLRRWASGEFVSLPTDAVDSLLLWEGTERLDTFWPIRDEVAA